MEYSHYLFPFSCHIPLAFKFKLQRSWSLLPLYLFLCCILICNWATSILSDTIPKTLTETHQGFHIVGIKITIMIKGCKNALTPLKSIKKCLKIDFGLNACFYSTARVPYKLFPIFWTKNKSYAILIERSLGAVEAKSLTTAFLSPWSFTSYSLRVPSLSNKVAVLTIACSS